MTTASSRTGARRRLLRLVSVAALLIGVLGWSTAAPVPASAGTYVPGSCGNWGGFWGSWMSATPKGASNDSVGRDRPVFAPTGPLFLDLTVTATGLESIRANDSPDRTSLDDESFDAMLYSGPAHAASFQLNNDGSFSYSPVAGYLGGDSFQYILQNGVYCTNIATVTIAPPLRPRAVDDTYTAYADEVFRTPLTCHASGCGILRNDLLGPTTVKVVKNAPYYEVHGSSPAGGTHLTANGTVTFQANGSFVYTPRPGFVGSDAFYYRSNRTISINSIGAHGVQGPHILPGYGKVTINVVASENSPVARSDGPLELNEDESLLMTESELLANDTRVSEIYQVGGSVASDTVATSSIRTTHGHVAVTWTPIFDVTGGCTLLSCPRSATGMIYTPDADYHGTDSFSYVAGGGVSSGVFAAPVEVALTILPVEDAPTPRADAGTVNENTSLTIDLIGNDSDPDGNLAPETLERDPCVTLPVCIFNIGVGGSWVLNGDGTVTFTPYANYTGVTGYHYQVSDTAGNTSRSFAAVTVLADPAVDDAYTTDEDTNLVVLAPGLLDNDRPGSLTTAIATQPANGSVVLAANGAFTYDPDLNFFGRDSFTYTGLHGDLATVSIEVAPVNDAPSLVLNSTCDPQSMPDGVVCFGDADDRTVGEGSAVRLRGSIHDVEYQTGRVLVDWGDGTSDSIVDYPCAGVDCSPSISPTWQGACGIFGCTGQLFFDLSHVYADEPSGVAATYTVTVTATDASNGTTSTTTPATVTNTAPTVTVAPACEDELCVGEFSRLTTDAGGTVSLRGRVTDPGADDGTLVIQWGDGSADTEIALGCEAGEVCPQSARHGLACLGPLTGPGCGYFTASHVYQAPSDVVGYAITLAATDDDGGVGEAGATAHVANAAPVATSFSLIGEEDVAQEIDLAANVIDYGTPDEELTFTIVEGPSNGELIGEGGTRSYTPDPNFNGGETFTFEVCDPEGLCASAEVSIEVAGTDDPPVAADDEVATDEDTPVDISIADLLSNDSDIDGPLDPVTFAIVADPTAGGAEIIGDTVRYTPTANAFGADSFTYEVCSDGACAQAVVTIEVAPVNDAPSVAVSGEASAEEGAPAVFAFEVTDADPGDTFTLEFGSPSCGTGALVAGSVLTSASGGSFSCRWADGPLDATASVTVLDADDAASRPGSSNLAITNVAPVITLGTSGPTLVATGTQVSTAATFTDPGVDAHGATVDWGDGTTSTLDSVVRTGFEATHDFAAAGQYTVTITVTDSDGDADAKTFAVEVVEPAAAVNDTANDLSEMLAGVSGRQAQHLQGAIDLLIGNNGGTSSNGAISAIQSGDAIVAVSRILDAEKALASVTSVDTSGQRTLLAAVARVMTEEVVADAKAAVGCDPTSAAPCSRGERKTFASIDATVSAGHTRYAAGDWVGAVTNYLKAMKAAAPLV